VRIARARPRTDADSLQDLGELSYTALAEIERCGYRFYLERSLGLSERVAPARATAEAVPKSTAARARTRAYARARGTLVHRVLESLDMDRKSGVRDSDIDKAARELGMRVAPAERADIARLVRRARAPAGLFERLAAARSVHREHPFALVLRGHARPRDRDRETMITGVIDVLAREHTGAALIVDYKTDGVEPGSDLAEIVEREYSLQRLIYALALLRDGASEVELVHWFLEREDGCVAARYAAADRERLEERLYKRVQSALERGFVPSDSPHRSLCERCPGRGTLCSWPESRALQERPAADTTADAVAQAA
jgi:ATP-dependent helicase/nuclease subunit A